MRFLALIVCLISLNLHGQEVRHDPFILYAIPKCGTHYLERTIELLIGKTTFNTNLHPKSLADAKANNRILRIFQPYNAHLCHFLKRSKHKMVLIYRDPRDAIVSMCFYMRQFGGKGVKRDFFRVSSDFDELSFDEQLSLLIKGSNEVFSYLDFYRDRLFWIQDPYVLSIRYEDMLGGVQEKKEVVQSIVNYLGISADEKRVEMVVENMYRPLQDQSLDGKIFVRSTFGNWKQFMNEEHRKQFKEHAGHLLVQLGYEKNMDW